MPFKIGNTDFFNDYKINLIQMRITGSEKENKNFV